MSSIDGREQMPVERVETASDVERVNAFFNRKTIKSELHRFTYSTTLERAFERDDRRLYYVEADGEITGALMVWCESRVLDGDEAQIRLVAVHPEHRSQGIARRLCTRAEQFATQYGKQKMSVDVARESPALEFWRSCGYSVAFVWETDGGRDMCRVEKNLSKRS